MTTILTAIAGLLTAIGTLVSVLFVHARKAAAEAEQTRAETKEILGGYNLIEADSLDEAVKIAQEFPWIGTGSIAVRPVRDFEAVRRRVGA